MGRVEELVKEYARFVSLPWEDHLAGPQKVWFVIYTPSDERRVRARIGEFELVTKNAGHSWELVDLTDAFGRWMASQEYRESYFESPEHIDLLLPAFGEEITGMVRAACTSGTDANTVVAISGAASLFGVARVSQLVQSVANDVRGRLVVFFPGERDGSNYRLLDAREGWNYLAVPISVSSNE